MGPESVSRDQTWVPNGQDGVEIANTGHLGGPVCEKLVVLGCQVGAQIDQKVDTKCIVF